MKLVFQELLLHPVTQSQLGGFINQPASGLLISGRAGSGKTTAARYVAASLLGVEPAKLDNHPYFLLIQKPADKSEISIDAIRHLISSVSLKAPLNSDNAASRVVLLQDANYLSTEAQNALLKLLEEPPAGTSLILTSNSDDGLLPTIVSRTQQVKLVAPTKQQSLEFFSQHPQAEVESAWLLSQGGVGLLSALLSDKDDHPLKIAVAQAKQFISQKPYQRLISLQKIIKEKELTMFLDGLARVLSVLYADNISKGNQATAAKILQARQSVETAFRQTQTNVNTRLIALSLVINIPL